ncbi:MAG: sialate O-acetylesterase [Saprospiraceae bacterium]
MLIKNTTNSIVTLFLLSLFLSCQSATKKIAEPIPLKLAYVFSDQMVLQQQEEVAFWGDYTEGEAIAISGSWGKSATTKPDATGQWKLNLPTPAAGGPFEVTVTTKDSSITFKDVMIGEVWLSSGQSNMEWKLRQYEGCVDNQEAEIANANYKDIRMFTVPLDLTREKIKDAKWLVTTPENAGNSSPHYGATGFSATAYFFARRLHKDLGVPIGIVNTAWGGTRVEAWTSTKKLKTLNPTKNLNLSATYDFFEEQEKIKAYNDSIMELNSQAFGFQMVEMPEWSTEMEDWENLDLNDGEFSKTNYDDTAWDVWEQKISEAINGNFEAYFPVSDKLLSDGVIWFRTTVNVKDTDSDYQLIIKDGIDDGDQTYFNGQLVGNTFGWNTTRDYKIPKKLLKKGANTIAIRVTDSGGGGGWSGPIVFKNGSTSQNIPPNAFKFKHHAFLANNQFLVHNYPTQKLIANSSILNQKIKQGKALNNPNDYGALFAEMLTPVIPYTIKGAIWYQGESNVDNYQEYNELFNGMIEDWRANWNKDFPFYFVQIAPFIYNSLAISQGLRDAQRKTLKTTPKTGMAIIMDIGEKDDIHPTNKQDVGDRLALLALDKDYGHELVSSGPLYKSHEIFPTHIEVDFDSKGTGLMSRPALAGFEIAGKDGVFYPAVASIVDDKVKVSSSKVSNPKEVRYAWKNWIVGTLFNKEGLPASSFSSVD